MTMMKRWYMHLIPMLHSDQQKPRFWECRWLHRSLIYGFTVLAIVLVTKPSVASQCTPFTESVPVSVQITDDNRDCFMFGLDTTEARELGEAAESAALGSAQDRCSGAGCPEVTIHSPGRPLTSEVECIALQPPGPFTIVPYMDDSEYRFHVIHGLTAPPASELRNFLIQLRRELPDNLRRFLTQRDLDVSNFSRGRAPFGSGGGCPLQDTVQTDWPVNSQLLIRRVINIPPDVTDLIIKVSVDNDIVDVFFDGNRLAELIVHEGCPNQNDFQFDVSAGLVTPGQHLLAFHLVDRGEESFFDTEITAEVESQEQQFVLRWNTTVGFTCQTTQDNH